MNINMIDFLVILYLFLCIKSAYSAVDSSQIGEYDFAPQNLELKPMFVDNENIEENLELKKFYDVGSLCANALKNHDTFSKTVNNYVQRYVSLFLIISGLFGKEEKDSDEMITVDLEITLSPSDLAYLQNFAKTSDQLSVLKDLSRLDAILSNIAKRKERGFLENSLRFSFSLLYSLIMNTHSVLVNCNFYQHVPFLTVLLVTWLIYRYSSRKSFFVYVSIFLNGMIFWESLNLYKRKIKDAEVELEALRLKRATVDCDITNPGWFRSVMNYFTGDNCLEYYKSLNRDPLSEVSLFKCIVDTYSLYIVQTPFKVLGASIRDFTGELSALWPKPLRWFAAIPILPFAALIVVFTLLILLGKKFRLSFFGASVEIGQPSTIKETKIITSGPRLLANYRPLRALTRSKLFRRSELDLVRERKAAVKASKSEPAVGGEKCESSTPLPITSETKDKITEVPGEEDKENDPETSTSGSENAKKED